jgi:hypothetical protein
VRTKETVLWYKYEILMRSPDNSNPGIRPVFTGLGIEPFVVPPNDAPDPLIQPLLTREEVLGQPIMKLLGTYDGTEGTVIETFGIEFASGAILNVSLPEATYHVDATTRMVSPSYDLYENEPSQRLMEIHGEIRLLVEVTAEAFAYREPPTPLRIKGNRLQSFVYYLGGFPYRNYFAILESGEYLTAYLAFNYTEFATAHFRDWRRGMISRLGGSLDLTQQTFFDAWNHKRIDPFSV